MRLALPVLSLALLAACSIDLVPLTDPPPTRVAAVETSNRNLRISKGVAIAVSCEDSCDGVCQSAKVTSNAPWIAEVKPAYVVTREGEQAGDSHAVFVVVGMEAGTAELSLKSECTDDTYDVTVVDH